MDIYLAQLHPDSSDDDDDDDSNDDNDRKDDGELLTDGNSYNYNGQQIPRGALKTILRHTKMGQCANVSLSDVDNNKVLGVVFVSERTDNLETLHFALSHRGEAWDSQVFNFSELYGTFNGVRMEDSGCFAGDRYFIYVSTKEPNPNRRQPWTAVYKTDLRNGQTVRLTPPGIADFSPSVSPSGQKIAVASLEGSNGWNGEIEDLKTDIFVMDVNPPYRRKRVIQNGGWPSWGTDDVIYFHRARLKQTNFGKPADLKWGVFRAQLRDGCVTTTAYRMTPESVDAMTPAAIDFNRVAVAIIRERVELNHPRKSHTNYRHIEVFDLREPDNSVTITQDLDPMVDHYNPFKFVSFNKEDDEEGWCIGYSCCLDKKLKKGEVSNKFDKLRCKTVDNVEVFRVPGVFPSFTKDAQRLAFVDNDFQKVYVADSQKGVRAIFSVSSFRHLRKDEKNVFSPVWSQNPKKDDLFICIGPPFNARQQAHIYVIHNASTNPQQPRQLTFKKGSNNAFPSSNPQGTKLVYRSTRDWVTHKSQIRPKNLHILTIEKGTVKGATYGEWIDTHCQWSPNGDWIVFSSTRDKPAGAPPLDHGLDPGYYSIYLMNANDTNVVVRVVTSSSIGAGHVNHPMFSPDGNSIVFAADLAGVSVEPISLPLFIHSVRPYGDIFSVNIDKNNIHANKDIKPFTRITHSRFENSTPNWSLFTTQRLSPTWEKLFKLCEEKTWSCPFADNGAQNWQATGHLGLSKRCC